MAQRSKQEYQLSLANSYTFCQSRIACGLNVEGSKGFAWMNGIGCGRWECPQCGPIKAKKLRKKIRQNWSGETCRFITLTCNSRALSIEQSCHEISHAWDNFAKRLRRRYPGIVYFKALEFTKDHRPHLHILCNKFIPQTWISQTWSELFASPIVWVERVGKARVSAYVTKYATKWNTEGTDSSINYFIFKLRRYSFSRNFYAVSAFKWKAVYYFGQEYASALQRYQALIRELLQTYDLTGVSDDDSVCFFKLHDDSDVSPP